VEIESVERRARLKQTPGNEEPANAEKHLDSREPRPLDVGLDPRIMQHARELGRAES
jgi:hypothetical protein